MDSNHQEIPANPLLLPELLERIFRGIWSPPDLLHCACVNRFWEGIAIPILYRGSLIDSRFRTPLIDSLYSLLVASRKRFAKNLGCVQHLAICSHFVMVLKRSHLSESARALSLGYSWFTTKREQCQAVFAPNQGGPKSVACPFSLHDFT